MPRIFLAGSGRQGVAAGYDLARFLPGAELTLGDHDLHQAERAARRIAELAPKAKVRAIECDVRDEVALAAHLSVQDAVLAGVPYSLNPLVHAAAQMAKIPSVDMGSDLPDLEKALGPRGEQLAAPAVFDSGLAPGLGNQLARTLIEETEGVRGVRIYCGGLPLNPRTAFRYRPGFSLEGLIGEYSDPAMALAWGKVIEVESMSGLERLTVPEAGGMEAFVTSGGASIGPVLFEGKLETYSYKTLRFPGHFAAMKAYRDLGLWSKEPSRPGGEPLRELFTRLFLERTAEEDPQDQVILLVEAWGRRTRRTRLFLRETFDEKTGLSAMERMTGFCASIVLQKTLGAGLTPALYAAEEVVSGREMLAELSRRGIVPRKA